MAQTRLGSFVEAWVNVIVGFVISLGCNWLILPAFGFQITLSQNLSIGCIMTAVSIARSYILRRVFNQLRLFHHGHEEGK